LHPLLRIKTKSRSGIALVIALGMVVLVTGLVVAFLSSASLERQVSVNSTAQARVDLLAKGALAMTVGDLRQEITAGSTVTNMTAGSTNVTLYLPMTNTVIVPARVGSDATLPNLVKRSASGLPFYSGAGYAATGVARAAASSTTNLSLNDRSISLARWNKALLLPKNNASQSTDLTPVSTFVPPDWVYVARDGSNPTAVSTNIVGRYAYAIYDEGGLLDANVAGYPSMLSPAQAAHKLGAATADLTQIGLTTAESDALVGWRNYSSAQPGGNFPLYTFNTVSGTNYYNAIAGNMRGFLSIGSPLFNSQSDRMLGGRQQLIQFLTQGVATSNTERASVQNALQYLGTFSRDINQPSFVPNLNRPRVVSKAAAVASPPSGTFVFPASAGGNDSYGLDDQINPAFLTMRATSVFTRNDGSKSVIGEPLIKKRFLLNRLCWLSYEGPSSTLSSSDTVVTQLVAQGVPLSLIQAGTAANILNYFGLAWDNTNKLWTYGHGTAQATINTLTQVQSLGRDPDFFELLKAGMVVGSLGKGAATNHNGGYGPDTYPVQIDTDQYNLDTKVDGQLIQIGANIIDQYSPDSYPRHISFNSTDFYGVENVPYLYRARVIGIPVDATASVAGGTGRGLMLLLPEVWNPHDPNSPMGNPRPTSFRFILTSVTGSPVSAIGQCRVLGTSGAAISGSPLYSANPGTAVALDSSANVSSGVTELDFSVSSSNPTACQQPVFLGNVNTAAGTAQAASIGLTVAAGNNLRTASIASPYSNANGYVKDMVSGLSYCGVLLGDFPLSWNHQVLASENTAGLTLYQTSPSYLIPLPLSTPSGSNNPGNPSTADECNTYPYDGITQVHYILQYKDANNAWRTYQDNESIIPRSGCNSVATGESNYSKGWQMDISSPYTSSSAKVTNNDGEWITWIDPRTSRFGAIDGLNFRALPLTPTTTSATATSYFGITTRPTTDYGQGVFQCTPGSGLGSNPSPRTSPFASQIGWYPGNWKDSTATIFVPGYYAENTTGLRPAPLSNANFFTDPDGVVRRGMGAYVSLTATTAIGMPMASTSSTVPSSQTSSRPFMLHRPFRSVAELGYVFSGTPWRNLDFFTPESGAAPLLDLFCVNDTNDPGALIVGKVSLNTRQPLVLQALLSGSNNQGAAYKDELNAGMAGLTYSLNAAEAAAIAQALVARTTSTATSSVLGQGPLSNLSELVGKWNSQVLINGAAGAVAPNNVDGSRSYVGFSTDVATVFNSTASADTTYTPYIQRLEEAAIRPLAVSGQTRVWNLMIDLAAQTGRYQPNATSLDQFSVDGERRYWLHVAIDRYTGQILDQQLEAVKE